MSIAYVSINKDGNQKEEAHKEPSSTGDGRHEKQEALSGAAEGNSIDCGKEAVGGSSKAGKEPAIITMTSPVTAPLSSPFKYLIDKIDAATLDSFPFRHLHLNEFLSAEHLKQVVAAPEIAIPGAQSDNQLLDSLFERGYKIIDFPGCITDKAAYVKWHAQKPQQRVINSACEGFGMTLRLMAPQSQIMVDLTEFMKSAEFMGALAAKFGLDYAALRSDTGLQKYLDGYEISPHPDTRNKALTFMVNVNPSPQSEVRNHHTHYLHFRPEYQYVQSYWNGNPGKDRCWVPWDWCESKKQQRKNNSIVAFAPSNETMHAVKASYNHLDGQRTQMYGNLWHTKKVCDLGPEWESFVVQVPEKAAPAVSLRGKIAGMVPASVRAALKGKTRT